MHDAIAKGVVGGTDGGADGDAIDVEIILVDDGSTDGSWLAIEKLVQADARVRGLKLAFNCGETAATDAGLRSARGKYVMTMDADLQNDPADIPAFLRALGQEWDCVCGSRVSTRKQGDDIVRVHTVDEAENPLFHRLLLEAGKASGLPVLYNTSFNLFGDPLVSTPRDAVRSFYSSGIDVLFVGNFLLEK